MSGTSSSACSICGSKSSCVNGSSVGERAASSIEGMSSGSIRIVRCAYEPTSRSPPCCRSYMFVSMSRTIGYVISPTVSANIGTGPTLIIWCTAGVSGIDAPAMRAMRGLQIPQHTTTVSARMSPLSVRTPRTRPPSTSIPVISVTGGHGEGAQLLRLLAHQRAGPQGVDHADAGCGEAPEDHVLLDVRHQLLHLGGREELGLDAPRVAGRQPALELLHPLGRARDLDAAALGEHAQLLVLPDAVQREVGHLLRVIDQEDEVRGVAGGTARVGERPLVEQHDVLPSVQGQLVGDAVPNDAGADDDDVRFRRQITHLNGSLPDPGPHDDAPRLRLSRRCRASAPPTGHREAGGSQSTVSRGAGRPRRSSRRVVR